MVVSFSPIAPGTGAAVYNRPQTSRGSSRGLGAYARTRAPVVGVQQRLVPSSERINHGLHPVETTEAFYEPGWTTHSMRSTRNRGMAAIPRWPNTLPWAFNKVVAAKEQAGESTRKQPQRTSYMESPGTHGMGGMWLGEGVVREPQPFMDANGGIPANPQTRSRRKTPYTLDTRTYAVYDERGADGGINGIERMLLHKHHLLPNTDERADEYEAAQPPQFFAGGRERMRKELVDAGRLGSAQRQDDARALKATGT